MTDAAASQRRWKGAFFVLLAATLGAAWGAARADTLTFERAGVAQHLIDVHVAATDPHPQYLWISGSGVPSSGTGVNGQHYIDVAAGAVYLKTAGTWSEITAFTGAVSSVAGRTGAVVLTKSDVGLGNVDNTSDASKPVSTATQTALDLKAPLASPALTGVPTAPTAAANTNTTQIATTAYVVGQGYLTSAPVTSVAGRTGAVTLTSADVGLSAVENTALSTWAGSSNVTTLGTIGTGTWQGSVIGSSYGGAGAVSGLLKANGSGVVSAAAAGTDYAAAPSGTCNSAKFFRGDGACADSLTGTFQVGTDGTTAATKIGSVGNSGTATTSNAFRTADVIQSTVTSTWNGYSTAPSTVASSFTLSALNHYSTSDATKGSGSAITTQTGYNCGALTAGGTNNFCFRATTASSATGAFNFYADGTAPNYFLGEVRVGNSATLAAGIYTNKNATGTTTRLGVLSQEAVQSDVTSSYSAFQAAPSTQNASFTLTNIAGIRLKDTSKGASSTVTNQYGGYIEDLTIGGTLIAGMRCDVSSGTGKWCWYGAGTADYYFKGNVHVNSNSLSDTTTNLQVSGQAKAFNWGVVAVNKGTVTSSTTLDFTAGEFQTFTTTASTNITVSFTAPTNPSTIHIRVTAPATNTPTITWPTIKGTALPTTVTQAKKILLTLFYDGTDYISVANSAEY